MKIVSNMKYIGFIAALFFLASCGNSSGKETKAEGNDKKVKLQQLKGEQQKLSDEIKKLEEELAKTDASFAAKPKLVAITPLETQSFTHYIDLQGKVETENIFYVTPRGQGGQVKAVFVKQGDYVKKGQLLLKLDDALLSQNMKQLETQLSFAKDLYNRQKNLWDQGIGTEVQLITAKNNVENLEKQVSILKEQQSFSNVYAEVSGVAEEVNIKVGEIFTGAPQSGISIVNPSNLKAVVDVPENYLSKVSKGAKVIIDIPDASKQFNSSISLISQVINANSRGFAAEAKIPATTGLKPGQLATVRIQDYTSANTIVVPMTALQTDENGKFVFVAVKENNKMVARKKSVQAGEVYGEKIEIKKGLAAGEQFISEGFQSLYDGQLITTQG